MPSPPLSATAPRFISVIKVGLDPTEVPAMPARVVARVPPTLIRRGRVLRPADAHGIYAHPRPEFQRLERAGALHRLADGHYAVVPDDRVGQDWLPDLESVALGIAAPADASTAPRSWGSAPPECTARSPARSTSRHRRPLQLTDLNAQVLFVRRDVAALDLQRHHNELGEGWITTVEQTLLDLIARPQLGGVPDAAHDAITALIPRADTDLLRDLARAQRRRSALDRVLPARP